MSCLYINKSYEPMKATTTFIKLNKLCYSFAYQGEAEAQYDDYVQHTSNCLCFHRGMRQITQS